MKIVAGEALQCYKQNLMGDANETTGQNADRNGDTKPAFMSFHIRIWPLLGVKPEAVPVTLIDRSSIVYPCPETMWEAKIKLQRTINLAEENPKHQYSDYGMVTTGCS